MKTGTVTMSLADIDNLDVIPALRKKAEEEVMSELVSLRNTNSKASEERLSLITVHKDQLEKQEKETQKILEQKAEEYAELRQAYKDLQEDKDMRKTEQILKDEISELRKELEAEKAKKWYNKIF